MEVKRDHKTDSFDSILKNFTRLKLPASRSSFHGFPRHGRGTHVNVLGYSIDENNISPSVLGHLLRVFCGYFPALHT